MHDEKMQKAIDQFVLERINACGQMESQIVTDAYAHFSEEVKKAEAIPLAKSKISVY